jgi:hypothetical protein
MEYVGYDPSNSYSVFNLLRKLQKMRVFKWHDGTTCYAKMIQRGELDHFDYNVGFHDVIVRIIKKHDDGSYAVRIWFKTVDDGDFGGWSNYMKKEEAEKMAERVAKEVFEPMHILPNETELNDMIIPLGMYVGKE